MRIKILAANAVLLVAYFLAGKLGLSLADVHPSATAVWPPTGIALAALLIWGYELWPGVLLGALLVNVTTMLDGAFSASMAATALGIAAGNTLEALLGAYLTKHVARGLAAFDHTQDTFLFGIWAALSCTVSATLGVSSLALGGFADWAKYSDIWLTWWLGDVVGALVIAPLIILWQPLWHREARPKWNALRFAEFAGLMACLALIGEFVFGGSFVTGVKNYPLEYLCIPFLIWPAFRFGQREAAAAVLLLAVIAIRGTLRGFGPFARDGAHEALLLLQAFVGVMAIFTMGLAAVFFERRRAEERAQRLAMSDPLTGLANYRKLVDVMDAELKRSTRTRRSFSVLLLDLDGLKKINDAHGHLTGSRALCRVAKALGDECRNIDTAARYGGDEFALVMPETEMEEAQHLSARVAQNLAEDHERPAVSVSAGAAAYPQDGQTIEALLGAADRALYAMKRRQARRGAGSG